MRQATCITRFIAYLPDAGNCADEELSRASRLTRDLGLATVRRVPYLLAIAAPESSPEPAQTTMLLDVFPGTAASARLEAAQIDTARSSEDLHAKAEESAQCYNLLQPAENAFVLESDALALKPVYTARTPGGHVMGSRIADLLELFPALAEPADTVALYELMTLWAPLAGRTLYQRIRRTLPGGRYSWERGGTLSSQRSRDLRPTPVEPHRMMDEIVGSIHASTGRSLADKTHGAEQPIWLALSGGFDSRLIAALCRDQGIDIRALTFARRQHEEWHSARAAARALALEPERVHYRTDNTLHHLATHLEVVEGAADLAALSIMPLLGLSSTPGQPLLHGFCGDLQAGSHIDRFTAADYASREAMADAILRRYDVSTRPDLRHVFAEPVDVDAVREDVLGGLRDDCAPYQAYLLWYLENRNRRYVGSQFELLGPHFDMIMPLYDRRLFDLWHSIPPVGLMNRTVFRQLMARHYPKLARIPHPEESAAITPNLRSQLGRFFRRLPQNTISRAVGAKRTRELLLRFNRNTDILTLSKLAAPRQRAYMLSRIRALRPALEDALGVALSPDYETVLPTHLLALRATFMVAEYAQKQKYRAMPAGLENQ